MKREIYKALQNWKQGKNRKPLILMGARQVGKTTLLKQFGETQYDQCIYLNFEEMPSLSTLFEQNLTPKILLNAFQIEFHTKITPENTLLIFDEVQECPNALNSLKYFCEFASEYHVTAAGSLLGVKLIHTKGFPVGKVNFLNLYPLSFLEFLEAIHESPLKQYLQELEQMNPIPEHFHEKLLQHFKIYLFTGGMPEVVAEYAESQDFQKVRTTQKEILSAYDLDFAKHVPKPNLMNVHLVWRSISSQLAKENKKFVYSVIRKGARAKEFETAIQWLVEAGLVYKVYDITTPKLPLDAYAKFDFFKLYLVDVGLLGAMTDLSAKIMMHGNQLFQEFRGSFVENYAAQTLAAMHHGLYYWTSEGKAELDFIFQAEDTIFPLEIKSGISSKAKSLQVYAEKYKPPLLIRSSPHNLRRDGNILNCPLYLLEELKRLLRIDL